MNEAPDWPNIIEEVASVGTEPLHAVSSLPVQPLIHMLKAEAWPSTRDVPHCQAEACVFRGDAADRFAPAMHQKISMEQLYRRALRRLPETVDGQRPQPVPAAAR